MKIYENYLKKNGFQIISKNDYWDIYVNNSTCIIIDYNIIENKNELDYGVYTKIQNQYMFKYNNCYRFVIENQQDLNEAVTYFNRFNNQEEIVKYNTSKYSTGKAYSIDPTPVESFFENVFEQVYGRDSLPMLLREYELVDIDGRQRFFDYVVFANNKLIAIEENGLTYHHPQVIGKDKYKDQLIKQNSMVAYGAKVFRWSSNNLKFMDVVCDEVKKYFGDKSNFKYHANLKSKREIVLYEHQENALKRMKEDRKKGENTFLIAMPTGTGKTKVIEEDLKTLLVKNKNLQVLIMVPSTALKIQWIKVLTDTLSNVSVGSEKANQIFVTTYAYMCMNYFKMSNNIFNYMVIDEAHHSPANVLSKIISHFKVDNLIGLTATPKRSDMRRLEKIYGEYEENITLKEAIEKKILSPIRAFRLESNLDLSEVRFNGKDYFASDLEKVIRISSRNELIVKTIDKYFGKDTDLKNKSGLVFCVSVQHANIMAKLLNEYGIPARAVSGKEKKNSEYIKSYLDGRIRFLCTCSLLTEGWDAPRTAIIVMARPTMSKVLYLQQLGRGTRKYPDKEALYIIDVVDNYGAFNRPWSVHGIFGLSQYLVFNDIFKQRTELSKEITILEGLYEYERNLSEIDIFTFEQKYADYLNVDQLARELFVSEDTIKNWIRKKEIEPDVIIPIGRRNLHYFKPNQVEEIKNTKNLKTHSIETIYDDFWEFIEKGDYTFSYKIIFILSLLKNINENGECKIDNLLSDYINYYIQKHENNEFIEKSNSPYVRLEYLKDKILMKRNMLINPFEKFERKRFMYYSKDLGEIAINTNLWNKLLQNNDIERLKNKMEEDLKKYTNNYN